MVLPFYGFKEGETLSFPCRGEIGFYPSEVEIAFYLGEMEVAFYSGEVEVPFYHVSSIALPCCVHPFRNDFVWG